MKILLIGDFSGDLDEGLKNIAKTFYHNLSLKNDVKTINVKEISIWKIFKCNYNPDVIHYFTAPTTSSLFLMKILSFKWRKSKKIISSLHPKFSILIKYKVLRKFFNFLIRTEILLYQIDKKVFEDISKKAIFFPNGVNIEKFQPVEDKEKVKLREKYDLDTKKFIILHVGHITSKRNLEILINLQKMNENNQVLIVASEYLGVNKEILAKLEENGCKILIGYLPNINEVYALADCYVFPVLWGNTITMPLTVLEAMASNLPIITLSYPSLNIFNQKGLFTVSNTQDIPKALEELKRELNSGYKVNNRHEILSYSWDKLTGELEDIYQYF